MRKRQYETPEVKVNEHPAHRADIFTVSHEPEEQWTPLE